MQLADSLKCIIIYSYTSVIELCSLVFIAALTDICRSIMLIMFTARISMLEIWIRVFWSVHTVRKRWKKERHIREEGQEQPEVEKEERYFDWQLSGLLPAEVVPPVDCYYQQKDFPIALAGTVSPLSPGGCYPIWEEMNRGPLAPYEVSVYRIFTEGAQWSKQALCQYISHNIATTSLAIVAFENGTFGEFVCDVAVEEGAI